MKLKSFGCSFIFGTELSDNNSTAQWAMPSKKTWPALLATQLNAEYHCYARPGSGNLEIANAVLDHIALNDVPCIYVIAWSWPQRFSFRKTQTNPLKRPGWNTLMPNSNNFKDNFKDIAAQYFLNLQSDYSDKLTHLMQVKNTLDLLRSNPQNKFIMTYMDHLLLDPSDDTSSPGITMLQAQCAPYLSTFDHMNFLEWSQSQDFSIGPNGHPLEEAHRAAAAYALDHFLV